MPQSGEQPAGLRNCVLPLWRALTESGTGAFLHGTAALRVLGGDFTGFFLCLFVFFIFPLFHFPPYLPPSFLGW